MKEGRWKSPPAFLRVREDHKTFFEATKLYEFVHEVVVPKGNARINCVDMVSSYISLKTNYRRLT